MGSHVVLAVSPDHAFDVVVAMTMDNPLDPVWRNETLLARLVVNKLEAINLTVLIVCQ